ncbi:hypothetical protein NRB_23600 [Novosphingobium sp. 11B]
MPDFSVKALCAGSLAAISLILVVPAHAQTAGQPVGPSYPDLVELSKRAGMVIKARVQTISRLDPAQVRNPTALHDRFYAQAQTEALIYGRQGIGPSLRYLVDLPQDRPELSGREVLLFAWRVPDKASDIKLVDPTAQVLWTPLQEARLRSILSELVAPGAPSPVTRVRELMFVPGNLAGQGQTQIFLDTKGGRSAAITVRHQPGSAPSWGVSFSQVAAGTGAPPPRDSLAWYSLACFLPAYPPAAANVSRSSEKHEQALNDYRMVVTSLGTCNRTR